MMGLAGVIQQLNIVTTRLKHDPSIGGSHFALQIASLLVQTHNNMSIMADDNDDILADRTCNNNNKHRQCTTPTKDDVLWQARQIWNCHPDKKRSIAAEDMEF